MHGYMPVCAVDNATTTFIAMTVNHNVNAPKLLSSLDRGNIRKSLRRQIKVLTLYSILILWVWPIEPCLPIERLVMFGEERK